MTTKSAVFAMRIDSKLLYLSEIAARVRRQSRQDFIRWALKKAIERDVDCGKCPVGCKQ